MKWISRPTLDKRTATHLYSEDESRTFGFYLHTAEGGFLPQRALYQVKSETVARRHVLHKAIEKLNREHTDLQSELHRLNQGSRKPDPQCSTENVVEQKPMSREGNEGGEGKKSLIPASLPSSPSRDPQPLNPP